jgi:hypothetical protein
VLDGGGARDIAFFNGSRANYTVTEQADGSLQVAHTNVVGQAYGIDVVRNVEILDFGGVQVPVG